MAGKGGTTGFCSQVSSTYPVGSALIDSQASTYLPFAVFQVVSHPVVPHSHPLPSLSQTGVSAQVSISHVHRGKLTLDLLLPVLCSHLPTVTPLLPASGLSALFFSPGQVLLENAAQESEPARLNLVCCLVAVWPGPSS